MSGKERNAKILAEKFGVFFSIGDFETDLKTQSLRLNIGKKWRNISLSTSQIVTALNLSGALIAPLFSLITNQT